MLFHPRKKVRRSRSRSHKIAYTWIEVARLWIEKPISRVSEIRSHTSVSPPGLPAIGVDRIDDSKSVYHTIDLRRSLLARESGRRNRRASRRRIADRRDRGTTRRRANAKTLDDRLNRTDYRTTLCSALLHPEGVWGGAGRGRPTATERCRSGSLHRKLRGLQLSIPALPRSVACSRCAMILPCRCGWHGMQSPQVSRKGRMIKPTDLSANAPASRILVNF